MATDERMSAQVRRRYSLFGMAHDAELFFPVKFKHLGWTDIATHFTSPAGLFMNSYLDCRLLSHGYLQLKVAV